MFYCLQVKSRPFASLSSQEKDVTKKKEQGDIKYNTTKAITKTRHALQRDWKKAATAAREHPAVAVAVGVVATYTALRVGIEVSHTTGCGQVAVFAGLLCKPPNSRVDCNKATVPLSVVD